MCHIFPYIILQEISWLSFSPSVNFSFALNNCFFLAVTPERDGKSIKVRLTDVGEP